jgi:S1-C subfamily serine protease
MSSLDPFQRRPAPEKLLPYRRARARGPGWGTMLGIWAIVFLFVWMLVQREQPSPLHNPNAEARPATPRGDLTAEEKDTIEVFREASPSVVYITSTAIGRDFFTFDLFEVPRGTGSGFIYDRQGHIVTNLHVILEGTRRRVTLADQSEWDAVEVGREPDKDIAVLKIDAPAERLKPITIGTSSDLKVGQKVLAIGNPFGFDQTLTVGVVSALGREIESVTGRKIHGVIQTDAAINPGNSGGPLLDSAGRLIGVNTQIASPSGASAGIGFAVPVDIVNEIVPDIIRYGEVRRPGLGVLLFPEHQTRRLVRDWDPGLTRSALAHGLLVNSVSEKGGAAHAGLRSTIVEWRGSRGYIRQLGDIIVKIDDVEVSTTNELKDALEAYDVGDEVQVTLVRNDKVQVAKVKLQYIN